MTGTTADAVTARPFHTEEAGVPQVAPAFSRVFAMPSGDTLSIPPIRQWVLAWLSGRVSIIDPFARNCRIGTFRNDLNPDTAAEYHLDAVDFCDALQGEGVEGDGAIFDPPYSPRQVSELYSGIGQKCTTQDTQNASLYKSVRDRLDGLLAPGSIVLSFGWNSGGMGIGRGYELMSVLMVHHGGAHNDTICIAERKTVNRQGSLFPVAGCLSAHPPRPFLPCGRGNSPAGLTVGGGLS